MKPARRRGATGFASRKVGGVDQARAKTLPAPVVAGVLPIMPAAAGSLAAQEH